MLANRMDLKELKMGYVLSVSFMILSVISFFNFLFWWLLTKVCIYLYSIFFIRSIVFNIIMDLYMQFYFMKILKAHFHHDCLVI